MASPQETEKIFQLLAKLFKPKAEPPRPPPGEGVRAAAEVKRVPQEQQPSRPAAIKQEIDTKKPQDLSAADELRKELIESGIKSIALPTTAEKMSVFLDSDLQKNLHIESRRLQGLIGRLQSEHLNWDEPSVDTWQAARSIVKTDPGELNEGERLLYNEIKQSVGEYYYRHKQFFEEHHPTIHLEEFVGETVFDGVYERMAEDQEIIASVNVVEYVRMPHDAHDPLEHHDLIDKQLDQLSWPEELPVEESRRIIAERATKPENKWIAEVAGEVKENSHALSFLADLAKKDSHLLEDSGYIFTKGAQFRKGLAPLMMGSFNETQMDDIGKVTEAFAKQFHDVGYESYVLDSSDPKVTEVTKAYLPTDQEVATAGAGKRKSGGPEKAASSHRLAEKEYWQEIADQMINDKKEAPDFAVVDPAPGVAVDIKQVNEHIERLRKEGRRRWLFEGKALNIKDPEAAQMVRDMLIGGDVVETKEALLVRAKQLERIVEETTQPTEKAKLEKLLDRMRKRTLQQYEAEGRPAREVGNVKKLLGEVKADKATAAINWTGKENEWDPSKDKLDPVKDAKLISFLNSWNVSIQGRPVGSYDRELFTLHNRLSEKFAPEIMEGKLTHLLGEIVPRLNELSLENSERYSTMFFEWHDIKRVYANMELALQKLKDQYDKNALLYPNSFQDAQKRSQGRMQEYLGDASFREKMKAYYEDKKNWKDINKYNDFKLNLDGDISQLADHPQYQKIINDAEWAKAYREVVESFSMADVFQQIDVSFRAQDLEKIADSMGAIAEHGEFILRKGRNGFNEVAFRTLDRKGFFKGAMDEEGRQRFLNGQGLKEIKDSARDELLSPEVRAINEPRLRERFGTLYEYEEAVDRAIEEMSKLHTMKIRRVRWGQRGLQIHLGAEQNDVVGTSFASVGPEEAAMQGLMPIQGMSQHWNMLEDTSFWQAEEWTNMDSTRIGSGEFYQKLIDEIYSIPDKTVRDAKILKFKQFVFGIVQKDHPDIDRSRDELREMVISSAEYKKDPTDLEGKIDELRDNILNSMDHKWYENAVSRNVGVFLRRDHETGELLTYPPKTLEEVTKEQLLRVARFRFTLETTTDPELLGSYHYVDASWIRNAKINIYDKQYRTSTSVNYRHVGLHERASKEVGNLFDFTQEGHDDLHHEKDKLVKRDDVHPQKEGILITMNKCSPVYSVDALKAAGYLNADDMFEANIALLSPADTAVKWNSFADQFLMEEELINNTFAKRPDLENNDIYRLNYAKFNETHATLGYSAAEYNTMLTLFRKLHPELSVAGADMAILEATALQHMKNHLKAGNFMMNWLLEPEQLDALKEPVVASYFKVVHSEDARDLSLDDEGNQFSLAVQKEDTLYSKGAGRVRNIKDLINVQKLIVPDLIPMMRLGGKEEEWEQHRHRLFYTVELTGGYFNNVKGLLYSTASFNKLTQIDFGKEMLGLTGEHPTFPLSIHERIVNVGGMARSTGQVDEQMHKASDLAGGKIEEYFPHITHEVELSARIIFGRIQWPKPIRWLGEQMGTKAFRKPMLDISEIRWPKPFRKFGRWIFDKTGWEGPGKLFNRRLLLKTVWVPRIWAWLLLGTAVTGFAGFENLKKGVKDAAGGSSEGH